jgi:hypothetical protein
MKYEFSEQKGKPGHCFAAQVFKNGKAFITLEPTEDEREASQLARTIAIELNSLVIALENIVDATEDKNGQFRAWHNHLRKTTSDAKQLLQ